MRSHKNQEGVIYPKKSLLAPFRLFNMARLNMDNVPKMLLRSCSLLADDGVCFFCKLIALKYELILAARRANSIPLSSLDSPSLELLDDDEVDESRVFEIG